MTLYFIGTGIGAFLFLIIYIAYFYRPAQQMEFSSRYLLAVNSQYLKMKHYNTHYVHAGKGKPVILLHGGGTWLYSYRDNIPHISKRFSTYAVDMPGHGYTKVLLKNPKYDLDMYSDFLLDFINVNGLNKVSLVGNSWGGGGALHFAQQHPERIETMVLIDSSGLSP